MKKRLTIISAIISAIIGILCLPLQAQAYWHNYYQGEHFETEQELEALEKTLLQDGYIEILTDTKEYEDMLMSGEGYALGYASSPNNCSHVYIHESDLEKFYQGEYEFPNRILDDDLLVIDYWTENSIGTEKPFRTIEEAAQEATVGSIATVVKGNMDAKYLQKGGKESAWVYLACADYILEVELSYFNNYTAVVPFDTKDFVFDSAFFDERYPVGEIPLEWYRIDETGTRRTLSIDFGEPLTKKEYVEKYGEIERRVEISIDTIPVKENQTDESTEPSVDTNEHNPKKESVDFEEEHTEIETQKDEPRTVDILVVSELLEKFTPEKAIQKPENNGKVALISLGAICLIALIIVIVVLWKMEKNRQ